MKENKLTLIDKDYLLRLIESFRDGLMKRGSVTDGMLVNGIIDIIRSDIPTMTLTFTSDAKDEEAD